MRPQPDLAVRLGGLATIALGVALPLMMAPASKSSPLFLAIAATFSLAAVAAGNGLPQLAAQLRRLLTKPVGLATVLLLGWMAASILWAHDPGASARQFIEFVAPVTCGLLLALSFPTIADRKRLLPWLIAGGLTAVIVIADLATGLRFRAFVGGRVMDYSYNRAIVTLVLLVPPLIALAMARRRPWAALLLAPVPVAVFTGESAAAVLGLAIAAIVLPVAWVAPRLTRSLGLGLALAALVAAPVMGTLAARGLGAGFHQTLASAHSSDRVDIWLSFEAAAQRRILFGNGFGASLNLQKAPVAAEIAPQRVTLLGASHPHNAFLQLWVELGVVGAALAAVIFVGLFQAVGRAQAVLQPFLLAWIAVICGIALVSHGAWQPWWAAAIAASAAAFLALARELNAEPDAAEPAATL